MSAIQVLDQHTINQIAAGEVIERPASVVKELLENAIDAGATAITAEIRDGGISLIRITDNGCGIPAAEVETAFISHATSKLRSAEDLMTVTSLGFRGEALPSIASVSNVEVITRTADSLTGVRYIISAGKAGAKEEIGAPVGTTFLVRDLFGSVPARKKFLKTPATEGSYVSALVEKLALAHPGISLRLIVNGQIRLHTSGTGNLRDVIYSVYGREISRELLEVNRTDDGMTLCGYIGKPLLARGNRSYEITGVGGRNVRSNLLMNAIEDAYHGFVMQHKYPFTVLNLSVDPADLDVNVHPAKLEVRFRREAEVYDFVYETLRAVLSGRELMPEVYAPEPVKAAVRENGVTQAAMENRTVQQPGTQERNLKRAKDPETEQADAAGQTKGAEQTACPDTGKDTKTPVTSLQNPSPAISETDGGNRQSGPKDHRTLSDRSPCPGQPDRGPEPFEQARMLKENLSYHLPEPVQSAEQLELPVKIIDAASRPDFRFIGIVFDTYLLVEYKEDFLMIDQHAAHEKVMYEQFLSDLENHRNTCQQCDPPMILTLNAREQQVLQRHEQQFAELGFEIEAFGGKDVAVRGVPGNIPDIAREDLFLQMLDELAEDSGKRDNRLIRDRIAMISCKAAVKGNMRLSVPEAEALIDHLLRLEHPYTCPHGRPTVIRMSRSEIEKKFKRIL